MHTQKEQRDRKEKAASIGGAVRDPGERWVTRDQKACSGVNSLAVDGTKRLKHGFPVQVKKPDFARFDLALLDFYTR